MALNTLMALQSCDDFSHADFTFYFVSTLGSDRREKNLSQGGFFVNHIDIVSNNAFLPL